MSLASLIRIVTSFTQPVCLSYRQLSTDSYCTPTTLKNLAFQHIKLAVDTRLGIIAGGSALHSDCEAVLLDEGSRQEDIWGADWIPETQQIRYEALINI